jgi:hypothetical protein
MSLISPFSINGAYISMDINNLISSVKIAGDLPCDHGHNLEIDILDQFNINQQNSTFCIDIDKILSVCERTILGHVILVM